MHFDFQRHIERQLVDLILVVEISLKQFLLHFEVCNLLFAPFFFLFYVEIPLTLLQFLYALHFLSHCLGAVLLFFQLRFERTLPLFAHLFTSFAVLGNQLLFDLTRRSQKSIHFYFDS